MADLSVIVTLWVCSMLGFMLCALRLILRKARRQEYNAGDMFTLVASICVLVRVVFVHLITVWGTTNTLSDEARAAGDLSDEEFYQRTVGSQLTVANRLFYNVFLWSLKLVVLDLCRRIIGKLPWSKTVLWGCYGMFGATFVAITFAAVLECRPFPLYWQIYPDPGNCVTGNTWLLIYGSTNIVTDMMLLAIPFPILLQVRTPLKKKLQLFPLFSLGFLLIAITIVRMVQTFQNAHLQSQRTTWGSIEVLAACLVAQAPILYTLLRPRHRDRSHYLSDYHRSRPRDPTVPRSHLGGAWHSLGKSASENEGESGILRPEEARVRGDRSIDNMESFYLAEGYADDQKVRYGSQEKGLGGILVSVDIEQSTQLGPPRDVSRSRLSR